MEKQQACVACGEPLSGKNVEMHLLSQRQHWLVVCERCVDGAAAERWRWADYLAVDSSTSEVAEEVDDERWRI